MKIISLLTLLMLSAVTQASPFTLSKGKWQFSLHLINNYHVNVKASVTENIITFYNGNELVSLEPLEKKGDSLVANFPLYHSCIVITEVKKRKLKGYWQNYSRGDHYKIQFTAVKKNKIKKGEKEGLHRISGKWETTIDYGKPTALIGDFKQVNNTLQGTFMSETGDYRFLEGNIIKDSMYLSCFDGTHCYLFTGRLFKNDSISGRFYSGNHYQTTWTAVKNPHATLKDPDSLTFIANDKEIDFTLLSTDHQYISYDSIKKTGKPTIIQLFGTWCPNCVDETNFLNEIHKRYADNVNLIGIGFEMGKTENDKLIHLVKFKQKMQMDYLVLLGGSASKKDAASLFPMLNHVMSFPTLIFINKHGDIVKIHTGFNGPATGQHFIDFQNNFNSLLEDLVQHN